MDHRSLEIHAVEAGISLPPVVQADVQVSEVTVWEFSGKGSHQ